MTGLAFHVGVTPEPVLFVTTETQVDATGVGVYDVGVTGKIKNGAPPLRAALAYLRTCNRYSGVRGWFLTTWRAPGADNDAGEEGAARGTRSLWL